MEFPEPSSGSLEERASRYRGVPRQIDGHLERQIEILRSCYGTRVQFRIADPLRHEDAAMVLAAIFALTGILMTPFFRPGIALVLLSVALAATGFWVKRRHRAMIGDELKILAAGGELALARIVIANECLFKPGATPHPAAVVFSLDPGRQFDADYLRMLAIEVGDLRMRETPPDDDVKEVWTTIRNDYAVGAVRIPSRIAGNDATYLSDVIVNPLLFPNRMLEGSPLLVLADVRPKRHLLTTLIHV